MSASVDRSVLLLSTATFSSMVAQRMCDPMLPALSAGFGVSLGQAAQVVSMFAIVYGLAQVIYGPLGDRWGKLRLVAAASLLCALANAWAASVGGLRELVWARMAVAAGAAGIIPLAMAWVGDSVPPGRLQETLARMARGTTLGLVSGQLLGGVLVDTLGWRWAFALMSAVFGLAGALLWRDAAAPHPGRPLQDMAGQTSGAGAGAGYVAGLRELLRLRWARWVLITALIEGAAGFGVVALWATHLHQTLGLALAQAGAVVAAFGVGGLIYTVVAVGLVRRLGAVRLAALGVSVMGVASVALALAPYAGIAGGAAALGGFGFFMFHNTMQAQAASMSSRARGTGVSLFAAALFTGQALGAALGAAAVDRWGSAQVLLVGAACLCLSGWAFCVALARRLQEPTRAETKRS